jgi:hypothetical protein
VNFSFHHRPGFHGDTYYDLRPKDRIALWVRIKRNGAPAEKAAQEGVSVSSVADASKECPRCVSGQDAVTGRAKRGGTALAFYDTATNGQLLRIPIKFIGAGGDRHER